MKSEQINELAAALSIAQSKMPAAKMNSTNPFLHNKYADLGAVIEAAKDQMAVNGLCVSQLVGGDASSISVTTILMHKSGQWIESTVGMAVGDEKGKSAAQVAGSIVTYLRRYSLASILGVYADEDTDGGKGDSKSEQKPTNQQQSGKPAQKAEQPTTETPEPEKPNGKTVTRPMSPETLKRMLNKKIDDFKNKPATDGQRNMLAANLETCFAGPNAEAYRKSFTRYIFGKTSTTEMTDAEVLALRAWLSVKQDSGGAWLPDAMAEKEANNALPEAMKAEGQVELPLS
jgi:hypothetical protein